MAVGRMREKMPGSTALIDDLRVAFGKEYIDDIIMRGMRGEPVFWITENGHTGGTEPLRGTKVVKDESGTRCIVVGPDGQRHKHIIDAGRREKMKG